MCFYVCIIVYCVSMSFHQGEEVREEDMECVYLGVYYCVLCVHVSPPGRGGEEGGHGVCVSVCVLMFVYVSPPGRGAKGPGGLRVPAAGEGAEPGGGEGEPHTDAPEGDRRLPAQHRHTQGAEPCACSRGPMPMSVSVRVHRSSLSVVHVFMLFLASNSPSTAVCFCFCFRSFFYALYKHTHILYE